MCSLPNEKKGELFLAYFGAENRRTHFTRIISNQLPQCGVLAAHRVIFLPGILSFHLHLHRHLILHFTRHHVCSVFVLRPMVYKKKTTPSKSQQFPVSYIEYSSEEHEKRFSIHHRFQSNNTEDRTAGETERTTFSKLIMFLILCREGRGGIIGGWRRTKVPRQRHQTSERPIAQKKVDFDDDVDESIND